MIRADVSISKRFHVLCRSIGRWILTGLPVYPANLLSRRFRGRRVYNVKIRPRKACRYPNLRSFGWVSYDKVGGLYSGKLGIRSEARASDLRSYPGTQATVGGSPFGPFISVARGHSRE